jgi:hypothetical protein
MDNEKISKHLNHLRQILGRELDFLFESKDIPDLVDITQAEIQINIEYYESEIKEIEEIVRDLEIM